MILPDFILPSRQNQIWAESGIDSLKECLDKKHFKSYPYPIEYRYNSRGFRDSEWPEDINELQNAIWCIGDSFTVGLGSPIEHTWPHILQQQIRNRTINISLDGASNNWIARKAIDVINTIAPSLIIIHWSYIHRRELNNEQINNVIAGRWLQYYTDIKDISWPNCPPVNQINLLPDYIQKELVEAHKNTWANPLDDEELRIMDNITTTADDIKNMIRCIQSVNSAGDKTKIIHSVIPGYCPPEVNSEICIPVSSNALIPEFSKLDLARDGSHYDIKTAQYFVGQILFRLI
jgi:hypothetical protein